MTPARKRIFPMLRTNHMPLHRMREFRWSSVTPTTHTASICIQNEAVERFGLQRSDLDEFPQRVFDGSFEVGRVEIQELRPGIHFEHGWAYLAALDPEAAAAAEVMGTLDPDREGCLFLLRSIHRDPKAVPLTWVLSLTLDTLFYLMRCHQDAAMALADPIPLRRDRHLDGMTMLPPLQGLGQLEERGFSRWTGKLPCNYMAVLARLEGLDV